MSATREPTVFVVDDDAALRKSLAWLIESVRLRVETFASAAEFLAAYDREMPGCLILDVRMPGMSGLELQQCLQDSNIALPIIVITGYGDVPMAVKAIQKGAIDFIEKPVSDQALLDRIQQAIAFDCERRNQQAEHSEVVTQLAHLTAREREVLDKVVEGLSSRQIGEELQVSYKTIEAHRAKIMKKMNADSVPQLVRKVLSCLAQTAGK
jgi:RNA polymerase sigma factor (sigma-70 family)